MTTTRELWFVAPGQVELRSGSVPALTPASVLVRALTSGVSQGTEMLLFRGEGDDNFDPSLDQPGAPSYPRRYGYCWVGEIIDKAPEVTDFTVGERVFALAPHGDLHCLPVDSVRRIESAIPSTRAVLAANLETAINCIWDSGVSIGDQVIVFGGGVVGLLIAWLSTRVGARTLVVEPSAARRELARQLGLNATDGGEPRELPIGADVVVEASGQPQTLARAIGCAGYEARIVVVSNYGKRQHALNLGQAFHRRRLVLQASQVSGIPASRAARWTPARRFALVARLLLEKVLDVLINNVVAFAEAPRAYQRIYEQPGRWLQTVFTYD